MIKILVTDDDIEVQSFVKNVIEDKYQLAFASSCKDARQKLQEGEFDLALLDVRLSDGSGIDILEWIKQERPSTDVIVISGTATIGVAVKAVKSGAYDFLEKPVSEEKLLLTIEHCLERRQLLKKAFQSAWGEIVTRDSGMKAVLREAEKVASTSANVLITGPSGTGKEMIAHFIHGHSRRSQHPFIKLNCSAIPEPLFESEFFGHEKGAFTGAMAIRKGKFEQAHQGTLFLDEIGDLPLSQQAKLLRVLEDKEIARVGSEKHFTVNVRIIAATNKNLEAGIRKGAFREDLYYRLNVINIGIPSLRERKGDIPLLAVNFLKQVADAEGLPERFFTQSALEHLAGTDFKGNIRELKNLVQRLFIISLKTEIDAGDVLKVLQKKEQPSATVSAVFNRSMPLGHAKKELEREYIISQLKKHGNNVSHTAKTLDILPNNLFRKIKEFKIIVD